ncbi:MAG: hypothetical protein K0R38_2976 [Polyangiaceae bacterium]|jgi:hypothetical protein|nr:hypothetical protein [Polyangiaceae bacterium]
MRLRAAFALILACAGCATYREDLYRGQRLYEDNQYERALAVWRALEPDSDSLSFNEQARYAYLRGMTDYRLGFRADSRHWLAIAKAIDQEHGSGLSPEWKQRLEESLEDLNKDVYGGAERFDKSRSTFKEHVKEATDEGTPQKPNDGKCYANADCAEGYICDNKQCIKL